jgi:hypothetical protein
MLVSGEVGAAFPVWSPDGGFILFAVVRYRIESWASCVQIAPSASF